MKRRGSNAFKEREGQQQGGHLVVLSYSRPTEPFRGDVRLMRVTSG
ncbi:MAG: hypothetical protein U1A78_37220 [Polyangia bacterium]